MWLKKETNALFDMFTAERVPHERFELYPKDKGELFVRARDQPEFFFWFCKSYHDEDLAYWAVPVNRIGLSHPPVPNSGRSRPPSGDLPTVLNAFRAWVKNDARQYVQDLQTVDLWAQIDALLATDDPAKSGAVDVRFTEHDKIAIRGGLEAFRKVLLNEYQQTPAQRANVEAELKHLSELLDRLDRKIDWRGLVISSLINIATTLAISPDQLHRLGGLFRDAMRVLAQLP